MTSETTLVDAPLFPRLIVKVRGRVVQEIEIRGDVNIGRAEENELQLTDPKASRHHARIRRDGRYFVLTDMDSANGTRVDGVLVTEPHILEHGQRITIGDTEIAYQEPGQAFQDTLTMEGVLPGVPAGAVPGTIPDRTGMLGERRGSGLSKGLIAGLVLAGVVLVVAVILTLIFLPGRDGDTTPTAQPVAGVTETQAAPGETPTAGVVQPTQAPADDTPQPPPSAVDSTEVNDLLAQAEALSRRSKFEDAIAIYEALVAEAPNDPRPETGWAWALILDAEAEEALAHAQRAVSLDEEDALATAALARVYAGLGETDEALATAQKAVDLDPGSAQAHAMLAEAYMLDGQMQQAVDEADLALVQDINNANAHRIRGWLYHIVDNDLGRAASELQIAAGLQPELWLRRHELGELLLEAEDYVTCIMAFQDALGIRPKAVTYTAIGDAYYRLGQYDQARASLQQAIVNDADDNHTYALMAVTYAHLNRCDEAENYYALVLQEEPTNPLAAEAQDLCESGQPVPTATATTVSASEPTPVATPEATTAPAAQPTARPAAVSGRIAFPVWNQETRKYDSYVANVDGSGRTLVAAEMHQPALSPDGAWVSVNGERHEHTHMFMVRSDGSGLQEITNFLEDGLPDWSPDGQRIVFSSTRHGDKQSRVYVIDEAPFSGGRAVDRPVNFGPDDVRGEHPAWLGDDQLVYSGCDVTKEPAPCGLFVISGLPGAHPFKQITDRGEDTAPDGYGDKIVFMSNREGNWEIYTINADGSNLRRLTNNAANDGLPVWSPDGRSIAFVSDQGGGWAVWSMNPDGSGRRKLFAIGGGGLAFDWQHEQISWSR